MSATITVQGMEELYQAVVAQFGDDAPEKIAVVDDRGEPTAAYPTS